MDIQFHPDVGTAYLTLDRSADHHYRLTLTADYHRLADGITLDFDAEGRVIGVGFEDARRQLSEAVLRGEVPVIELDPGEKYGGSEVDMAYLYLDPTRRGRAEETLVIDDEESRSVGE
jgi:uncharacterized protein YuzE